MKRILILFTLILTSITCLSQVIDYPRYDLDSLGQKVVVITIEQAQVLNNKAQLLELFEKLNVQMGDYDSVCLKVIGEKDIIIAQQDLQISNLKDLSDNKDNQIDNLQEQILDYKAKELLWSKELENKNKEIKLHKDKISDMRTKMIIGGSVGGAIILGLIALLISN
jgi:hypothetical protein